ncbi:hypothetical protein ACJ73_04509 [Blastomyces percursus]|uniref:Uncharacterized protein n=1 Tax=Blastomyces percursus TaxID=1658174 RepID=A0A1J9Q6M2_9EURO|nr:hypothetical protein ACJ73_04509 [Blastomyces percursus]
MEVQELKGDLDELYRSRSSYWVPNLKSVRTGTAEWKLGPIFTERETYDDDGIYHDLITEAAGVCVATQVKGPQPGIQGIAKIRMQIPNDPDNPSSTKPHNGSTRSGFEWVNLRDLTERGCTCTPRLLDIASLDQAENYPVPGGFMFFIVMERLPGRNLVNFADLPMPERDQVRLAFAKAIREFYSFRFVHRDPDRRNLMWDSENKKCYIIDLEDAHQINDDSERKKFIPEQGFYSWGIAGPEINTGMYGVDPMVPYDLKFIEDPDDETLERMAKEAEGKELVFPKYDWYVMRPKEG